MPCTVVRIDVFFERIVKNKKPNSSRRKIGNYGKLAKAMRSI